MDFFLNSIRLFSTSHPPDRSKRVFSREKNRGYVAISSLLVIAAIVVVIGIANSLTSISEGQLALADKKKESALSFVEACVNDALLYLSENNELPSTVTLPQGSCSVTTNSHVGTAWTFTVSSTVSGYTKNIQVQLMRTSSIVIVGWEEN